MSKVLAKRSRSETLYKTFEMNILIGAFLGVALVGFVVGSWGQVIFSLLIACVAYKLNKSLDRRDAEFNRSPRAAKTPAPTGSMLTRHDTECTANGPGEYPK